MTENASGINWRRITAEGFAIVFSILVAFAIDAWWEDFQLAQDEQLLLESLAVEIETAYEDLDEAVESQQPVLRAAELYTHFSEETSLDTIATVVRTLFRYYSPAVQISSVNSVLASGRLDDLTTEGLAEWVAAWPVIAEDLEEEGQTLRDYVHGVIAPHYASRGIPLTPAYRGVVPGYRFGDSIPLEELRRVVGDPGFDALFQHAGFINFQFLQEAESVRTVLEEGYALVQAGLGNADARPLGDADLDPPLSLEDSTRNE